MRSTVPAAILACLSLGACAHVRPANTALPTAFEGAKGGPDRVPATVRIGEAYKAGRIPRPDREGNFEFGLQRVLDGVEAYIKGKR